MKVLVLDIETTPNVAHVWGLWKQNIGINQILEAGEVLCFAARWLGEPTSFFSPLGEHGRYGMVQAAWNLLNEADAVVHYNGKQFDIPLLNREFLLAELSPPSPFKHIDLLTTVRKKFRFPSTKLDYVARELGLGRKTNNGGHETWIGCLAGDREAWARMRDYNTQDVELTESLYYRLLPWIDGHPHPSLYDEETVEPSCTNCGSFRLERRGFAYTAIGKFQQYQCRACDRWVRGSQRIDFVEVRPSL